MRRFLLSSSVALVAVLVVAIAPLVLALNFTQPLAPGDSVQVTCPSSLGIAPGAVSTSEIITCATLVPTSTPVPTATACGVNEMLWQPPVVNGCVLGHEHGDAPPAWLLAAGITPMFQHMGNTPNEFQLKETSFKAFAFAPNGVNVYAIMHLDGTPSGHTSRFHSFQLWMQNPSGSITALDYWLDFGVGNNTGPQTSRFGCDDTNNTRPTQEVNDRVCNVPLQFETWYSQAGGTFTSAPWEADLGFSFHANYYGNCGDPLDRSTWAACATGSLNDTRRMEVAWYSGRPHPTGDFYTTQFGTIVSGPADPACSVSTTIGAKTYAGLCIKQHIAPDQLSVQFPGNSVQKTYDMTGVTNPN